MEKQEGRTFTLTAAAGGERIDRFLVTALPDLSRAAIQRLIDEGNIAVGDLAPRPSYKVRQGDVITVHIPPPQPTLLEAESLPLSILYEDADILVIDKPAGLVVHPGAGNPSGTLVNAILAYCPDLAGIGGELRPGIVHRLDKDTSGVLITAKNDHAIHRLQQQFKQHTLEKVYLGLFIGRLPQNEGLIEGPIGRHPVHRQKMAVVTGGKPARTRWHVLRYLRDRDGNVYTLAEIDLLTGRTHQIRVHFSWLGYPLVGDRTYGPAHPALFAPRQFLHARELRITHPTTGDAMSFVAPLPDDLKAVLETLRED